jgi:3-oxoacyl-[acyl-carrier protein] reductase
MVDRRFGRIVNITSSSVRSPILGLDLSSGARAGLTAFLAGPARDLARHNVTINSILPGSFETDRLKDLTRIQAETEGKSPEEVAAGSLGRVPARRFGQPEEFGRLCAFLCSDAAGYIVGQNILIDGGRFNAAI